jgi:PAS domain S-box-containing protein
VIVNGQKRWQEWTDRAIFDDWGKIKEIQGLGVDITERKIAEEALKESEASFRSIFENAAIGMALADLNGHCYQFNDKLLEFLGYSREELSTNSFDTITHPKDISLSEKYFQESLNGLRDYFSFDKRFICKNGVVKWGNITVSLVRNAETKPKHFIVVIDDISARKEAQIALEKAKQAAEDANLAKSQFLANMSHELRTPLNAILGFTQLMARSRQLNPQHQEYLHIINRAGEHLLSLINDILDLSRIEAGKVELYQETFDLHNLLDAVEKMLVIKAKGKNLELVFEVEESISYCINTDPNKLRSVLINILGNAIKFTNEGRVILRVRGKKINDHQVKVIFEVEDTGVGIHPQDLKNLFNVFVQAKSGQQSGEGSGLGLAISQRFVNLMGGEIKVNSEVNKGSIFTFNIIAGMERNNPNLALTFAKTVLHLSENQSSPRILIVEDKQINRQFLTDLLSTTGFEIREAVNGQEAIALWQTWQPELILMDIRMPVMNGYQAIREIRRLESLRNLSNPVKIIAVTASVLTEEKHLILEAGCDDFIAKPVRESDLFSKIAHHLDVSYVYDTNSATVTKTPSKLEADDLLIMPQDWREELYKAAIAARSKKISQLINEIPVENKGTIEALTKMVQQLDFEKIMAVTKIIQ